MQHIRSRTYMQSQIFFEAMTYASLVILALEQGKKQVDGLCLLQILRALDTTAGSTSSNMTDEAPVLDVGDLVIVRDVDEFSVVRADTLPPSHTTPGSSVRSCVGRGR